MDSKIYIIDALRTPFGKFCGKLKHIDYYELGAILLTEMFGRQEKIKRSMVDEVFWGVGDTSVCKDVYTPLADRQTLLMAGFPSSIISTSIERACVSSMTAIRFGFDAIRSKRARCVLGGGTTSFSREPYILRGVRGKNNKLGDFKLEDPLFELGYKNYGTMAGQADNLAIEYGINRYSQDVYAYRSHEKYRQAMLNGKLNIEFMNLFCNKEDNFDEQFRLTISMKELSELKPIYGTKTITAGNSPGLNDGAAAVLIASEGFIKEFNIEPIAEIIDMITIATNPDRTPEAPAIAVEKILLKNSLDLNHVSFFEINEAFSAVVLVSLNRLFGDRCLDDYITGKVNVNGGAIAIGHPNTASGARIMMTAAHELKRREHGIAVCSIGGALGIADACILRT
uniref:Putative acetyl-CoA acetyltransferase n=1 Tax=viral metagenome TaxID=1070528 RepID=A0A6M3J0A9_9ZZZZ